jgi:hypothetical protein
MKQVRNFLRSGALQTAFATRDPGHREAQFSRANRATDQTKSFVVAIQALLATHGPIQEQRVAFMNTHFPYDLT